MGGFGAEEFCGIAGRGLQGFHGSEARLDEIGEFVVEAEAGEDVDAGSSVGSCEERNAGVVHVGDHFQVAREIFFPECERIFLQLGNNFVVEALPGDIAPVRGDVFAKRIVGEIALIEKCAAALPGERWALPGVCVCEQRQQSGAFFLVGGAEQKFCVALPVDKFLFFAGEASEAALRGFIVLWPAETAWVMRILSGTWPTKGRFCLWASAAAAR